jgi:predicted ATPase/DNA-binding winged helix-turn-helix (wHTH) protein
VPAQAELVYEAGSLEIDAGRRELRARGVLVPIGGRAFEIIETLVRSAGELVTKDELMQRVWPGAIVEESTIHVHISAIRKALGADRVMLKTTSGRGYRLLGRWTTRHRDVQEGSMYPASTRPPAQTGQSNLPVAPSVLIGRAAALKNVRDLMSAYRMVTLTGPGGIGKTRLALEVAHLLLPEFQEGSWLVELASLSAPNLVASAVASVLGISSGVGDISAASVAQHIGRRRVLIVLDNCEHVVDAAAKLAEAVIGRCPMASILATGRELLGIDGEHAYRVAPLDVPPPNMPEPSAVCGHSAVQLFIARTLALRSDFAPRREEFAAVGAICRRLDGIPLAIEFAAARAVALGIEEVLSRLDDRFRLLTSGRRTALPRHRTLLATLDWSHDLLPEAERLILRRLAVFAGGFALDAACVVAATPGLTDEDIVDGVSNLASKSLLVVEVRGTTTRFSFLETVRAYALEKLRESGEVGMVMPRYAGALHALLLRAQTEWAHRPIMDWRATYRRDLDNIRNALDWAFSPRGEPALAVTLTTDSILLMFDLSLVVELHGHIEAALRLINAGVSHDPRCEMDLLTARQAARVYTEGPSDVGLEAWETVLRIATELDNVEFQTRALWGLWNDNIYRGAPALALGFARRFAELCVSRGDLTKQILGQRIVGITHYFLGEQFAAQDDLEGFLSRYVREDKWNAVAIRLNHATLARATLVPVLWLRGEVDKALSLSEIAVSDALTEGQVMSTLYVLVEAAVPLSLLVADHESTGRHLHALIEQAERAGFRIWRSYGRCFQEVLRIRQGDHAAGVARLIDTIRELREIGFCAHLAMFLGVLAGSQGESGLIADALATINEAIDWSENHEALWYSPELLRIKAEIILREASADAFARSATILRQAISLAHRQGALAWELRAAMSLARLLRQGGDASQAFAVLAPVYERFSEGFGTADLVSARRLLEVASP